MAAVASNSIGVQPPRRRPTAIVVNDLTDIKPYDADSPACDADEENSTVDAGSDTSCTIDPPTPSRSNHEPHKPTANATPHKYQQGDKPTSETEPQAMSDIQQERLLLISKLGPGPTGPPFQASIAVMYRTDENGHYIPTDNTSVKRQKLVSLKICETELSSDEDFVYISHPAATDGFEDQKDGDGANLGSPAAIAGEETNESDDFWEFVFTGHLNGF
ncbi:MAG: hypothetical protein M1839_009110 [Geoglossum umbratile]|nr:MAG: hypothetical protein M1839_009110 [Geoglossum umbratile]